MTKTRELLESSVHDFRRCWKELALIDIAYKLVAFVLLTPLLGILFRFLIAVSGRSILADEDILFFFLGPVGWVCLIALGSLWLGIIALEQAALMRMLCGLPQQEPVGVLGALQFAATRAWPVIRVTARMIALALLAAAPFLAMLGIIYLTLLTQHDINFYLSQKPPVFWAAVGLGGVTAAAFALVLLHMLSGWLFALPLLLFENVSPSDALRVSRERAFGHRRTVLLWILGWGLASTVVSAVAIGVVALLGRLFVPLATGSLAVLLFAVGVVLILWTAVTLAVNLLSNTTLATMLFNLYRQLGSRGALVRVPAAALDSVTPAWRPRLTRGRLVSAAAIGVVMATGIGVFAIRTVRLQDNVEITAHRGASASAPENTLAAVEKAIEEGADWAEIDVQETAEGEVVVFHDSDFKKVAGLDLRIWDATLSDLEKIDIGSWKASEFRDQRVPTLGRVLELCRGKIRVNIELKYYGHDQQLEQRVVDLVEAHDMESDIVVMSLKRDAVKKMKALRPKWKVGLLTAVAVGDLTRVDADFLAVSVDLSNRRFVRAAQGAGKEVHVWTVNDPITMSTMMGRGVDNVITDKPALARSVLEQRKTLSAPERLLLELAGILGVQPQIGEP